MRNHSGSNAATIRGWDTSRRVAIGCRDRGGSPLIGYIPLALSMLCNEDFLFCRATRRGNAMDYGAMVCVFGAGVCGGFRVAGEASRGPVAFCGRASVTDAYPGPATEVDVEWDNFRPSWV